MISIKQAKKQQLTDELLIKLANHYKVSIDYLLCQTNNPKRNT